jgi:rare lipoprotein A
MHHEQPAVRRALRPGIAAAASLLACLLGACGSPPRRPTPPPSRLPPAAADASAVPDAVPRAEPRSAHGNPPFYEVDGRRYTVLASASGYVERGVASWYGPDFHGHNTSSGEGYDMYGMTAAHKTLPLPCYARITNLANGRSVIVRINDRGPFVANRIVDLSYTAAQRLDVVRAGTAFVELRVVGPETMIETNTAPAALSAPPAIEPTVEPAGASPAPPAAITPPPVAPERPLQAPAGLSLYIQVGAYGDPANAARVAARLQAAGMTRVITLDGAAGGRTLQRVRVGPIASVEDYDQLAQRLARIGFPDARLATD